LEDREHAPKRVKFVLPATAWAKIVWISHTLAMDLRSTSTHAAPSALGSHGRYTPYPLEANPNKKL